VRKKCVLPFSLWCAAALCLLLLSCREKDSEPPLVNIISPAFETGYSFGEWVEVRVSASDETGLKEVVVSVTDLGGRVVVGPWRVVLSDDSSWEGEVTMHFNDVKVSSGSYVLRAKASDGSNESQDVLSVTLTGAPKTLERILVTRESGALSTAIDSVVNGTWYPAGSWSGQYQKAAVNSWDQRIHLFGRTQDGIITLAETALNPINQFQIPFGLSDDLFEDVYVDESLHEVWTACRDGQIRRIGVSGTVTSSFAAYSPRQVVSSGNYIYSFGENEQSVRRLEVYVKQTGQLIQSLPLNSEVRDLLPLSSPDQVLLVRNAPGGPSLIPYFRQGNYLDEWTPFNTSPESTPLLACHSATGIIVAYADGVRRYSLGGTLAGQSSESFAPVHMTYQEDNGALWLLESDALHRLSGASLNVTATFPAGPDATQVLLLYNK
jgi:hypothetical protein